MPAHHSKPRQRLIAVLAAVALSTGVAAPAANASPQNRDWSSSDWHDRHDRDGYEHGGRDDRAADIESVEQELDGLRAAAETAFIDAAKAGEEYQIGQDELAVAATAESGLATEVKAADTTARKSWKKRGHHRHSREYRRATSDQRAAAAVRAEAARAHAEHRRHSSQSAADRFAARSAEARARAAADLEASRSGQLFDELAGLKRTTAAVERAAAEAAQLKADRDAFATATARAAAAEKARVAAVAAAKAKAAAAEPVQKPTTPIVKVVPPAQAKGVTVALGFARKQLGKPYVFGGAGPNAWDCSGLTKASYAAARVVIGTHSATNQYNTMAKQKKLVSLSTAKVGDLLFWGKPGNYYHVAIYMGAGKILESPNPRSKVRIWPVWSPSQVAPLVGRPSP